MFILVHSIKTECFSFIAGIPWVKLFAAWYTSYNFYLYTRYFPFSHIHFHTYNQTYATSVAASTYTFWPLSKYLSIQGLLIHTIKNVSLIDDLVLASSDLIYRPISAYFLNFYSQLCLYRHSSITYNIHAVTIPILSKATWVSSSIFIIL